MIKFVSDLRQVGGVLPSIKLTPTIFITEILLKVAVKHNNPNPSRLVFFLTLFEFRMYNIHCRQHNHGSSMKKVASADA